MLESYATCMGDRILMIIANHKLNCMAGTVCFWDTIMCFSKI